MASFLALYGWQVVPNAIWWCQVVTGWSLGAARGLSGGYRAQTEGFRKFGKRCFLPPGAKRGGLGGILPPILGRTGPLSARRGGLGGILPPIIGHTGSPLTKLDRF